MAELVMSISAMIILTGLLLALSGAVLGTFLVLRGAAMLTDAISHSVVLAIVLVWMLTGATSGPLQVAGAVAMGLATVGLTALLQRSRLIADDAAIGLVFPALFAGGVLLINLHARDVHIDLDSVLLGEIGLVWLHRVDVLGVELPVAVVSLGLLGVVNLAFVLGFWKHLVLSSFDAPLAAALGLRPGVVGLALMALTAATAVAAFEAVGAILFIAFVTAPAATGLLLSNRPGLAMATAVAAGSLAVLGGHAVALGQDLPIAPVMALCAGGIFALALALGPRHGLIARLLQSRAKAMAHASRGLVAHLHAHENDPAASAENSVAALSEHLLWTEAHARRVLLHCLDRGLVRRDADRLYLTEKGRAEARSL
jgi:manganese/zinc/iron transport system permease protein